MADAAVQHHVATANPPAKFSRYRSVRAKDSNPPASESVPLPPLPPPPAMASTEPSQTNSIARSMSRYHRRPNNTAAAHQQHAQPLPRTPPMPHSALAHATHQSPPLSQHTSSPNCAVTPQHKKTPRTSSMSPSSSSPASVPARSPMSRHEARNILEDEQERQRQMKNRLREEQKAKLLAEEKARRAQQEAEKTELDRLEKLRLEEEADRNEKHLEAERAEKTRRLQAEADRLELEKQRSAEKERESQPQVERRGLLRKIKKEKPHAHPETQSRTLPQQSECPPDTSQHDRPSSSSRRIDQAPRFIDVGGSRPRRYSADNGEPVTIKPGGGGIVPGTDAPISAVNAGDRRVLVECGKSSILLPITPTTSALEVIRSASTCLSEPINVKSSILLESFSKVGLERPLRKYEHVRDVMNSWDDDKQNSLVIVPSPDRGADDDLTATSVSQEEPAEFNCFIYHSSKPGKWNKRWVTLRPDGQLLAAKNEFAKDSSNVCHLSDFDIYKPTVKKLSKSVKPPKKICYAIKSQQKSSMFMDTSMFVHFFCTSDPSVATSFYRAVQGWRSWYLINVMGEGSTNKPPIVESNTVPMGPTHKHKASVDSHYELGSFKPLLDMDNMDFSQIAAPRKQSLDIQVRRSDSNAMHQRKKSLRDAQNKKYPPVSFRSRGFAADDAIERTSSNEKSNSLTRSTSRDTSENKFNPNSLLARGEPSESTFNPKSLLGRAYQERLKAQQEREKQVAIPTSDGPFTNGGLLSQAENHVGRPTSRDEALHRSGTRRDRSSSHDRAQGRVSGDLHRSGTTRQKPKPLVDLTPQYREPPQHARKGRGYRPDEMHSGGLVEAATSLEQPYYVPSSSDWRRPNAAATAGGVGAAPGAALGNGKLAAFAGVPKGAMGQVNYVSSAYNPHAPEDSADAFTGKGLLANAGFSQGDISRGHGIMDGSKAKGPMLDMSELSKFVPGSLLSTVEKETRSKEPIIDREKRKEEVISTGEGL